MWHLIKRGAFFFLSFGFRWKKKGRNLMSKRNSEGEITHVNWNQKQLTQICWEAKLTLLRHKPTHCPFFVLFIYLSGASESPNPCSLLGVRGSQVTKERGKAREGYRGETERLQCSRKMEQIMYYAAVNRRKLRAAAQLKGKQDVC